MSEDITPPVVDADAAKDPASEIETPPAVEEVQPAEPVEKVLKNLFAYLSDELEKGAIDHSIRAARTADGHVYFYIHPSGKDGDTQDYYVSSNGNVTVVAAPGPLAE